MIVNFYSGGSSVEQGAFPRWIIVNLFVHESKYNKQHIVLHVPNLYCHIGVLRAPQSTNWLLVMRHNFTPYFVSKITLSIEIQ